MKRLIVDFVMPEAGGGSAAPEAATAPPEPAVHLLSACSCGANDFVLASELKAGTQGIPASRMYECLACGTYRLG